MTDDLRFAGNLPVVINRNGDTQDVYNPIRSSSCDITVVSNKILSDLYTNDKKGIKVKIEKVWNEEGTQDDTLYEGYMTPNTYSQNLSPNLDNIYMTTIDPLALLKYIYVDDILEKAKSITMGNLIAKALAAVKIDCIDLWVEKTVSYTDVDGDIKDFVDFVVQTNNFWDEGDDPSSVYDMVSECLRLFGYTLTFTGVRYMIYNVISDHDFGTYQREFIRYKIEDGGTLRGVGTGYWIKEAYQFKHSAGEWTTIDDSPTVSIDNTYDKIVSVASTKKPDYSYTAFDLVSSDERDKYDVGDLNVARNKIKGYKLSSDSDEGGVLMSDDDWYYIWNGVYVNDDFGLNIEDAEVNGYANINSAYVYMTGETGHPNASGAVLNFYGGGDNPMGDSRDPQEERAVDINECITVFAPDNGIAPEFLDKEDLVWNKSNSANPEIADKYIIKNDSSNAKYGVNKTGVVDGISYKQKYENITMSKTAEQTLNIELSHSYSRTGINQNINIPDFTNVENRVFDLVDSDGGGTKAKLYDGTFYTYPDTWQSSNVNVDVNYFYKYYIRNAYGLKEVWDKRKIILFIQLPDGTKYQFNGKDWVETEDTTDANAFYLKKLMNYEKIFNTEFTYNLIECGEETDDNGKIYRDVFALNEDGFKYYTYPDGGVVRETVEEEEKGILHEFTYYGAEDNTWKKYISSCDDGSISIILPALNVVNALVECDIYHSSLLGITGNDIPAGPTIHSHPINYKVEGVYRYWDATLGAVATKELTEDMVKNYGKVETRYYNNINWMPINATYVKAEHLNLGISLSVPESNLGQMFGESDIRYSTNHSKRFRETYDAPSFLVNTRHPIVSQSHSYVIVGNALADANRFNIGWSYNKIACRPENYVMQGYKNYWGVIRRTYNRVLVPHKAGFSNCLCFIEAPDIPDVGNGRWLMVVSDSWDVKTNRHTISAVEDYDLNVNEIENYTVLEIPREARNPRFNLPSVKKK